MTNNKMSTHELIYQIDQLVDYHEYIYERFKEYQTKCKEFINIWKYCDDNREMIDKDFMHDCDWLYNRLCEIFTWNYHDDFNKYDWKNWSKDHDYIFDFNFYDFKLIDHYKYKPPLTEHDGIELYAMFDAIKDEFDKHIITS